MANTTQNQTVIDENFILEASIDNTRNLSLLLKAIHFRDVSNILGILKGIIAPVLA